jgi:hypothetical protein
MGGFLDFLKTHWFWLFQNVSKSKNPQFQLFFKNLKESMVHMKDPKKELAILWLVL